LLWAGKTTGQIEVMLMDSMEVVQQLEKGDMFGQVALVGNTTHEFHAKAAIYSEGTIRCFTTTTTTTISTTNDVIGDNNNKGRESLTILEYAFIIIHPTSQTS